MIPSLFEVAVELLNYFLSKNSIFEIMSPPKIVEENNKNRYGTKKDRIWSVCNGLF